MEMIGGATCKHCGIEDIRVLEIDHVWGNGKEMPLSKSDVVDYYLDNVDLANEELQVLCRNCHRIKTLESGDLKRYRHIHYDEILVSRNDIPKNNLEHMEWYE